MTLIFNTQHVSVIASEGYQVLLVFMAIDYSTPQMEEWNLCNKPEM